MVLSDIFKDLSLFEGYGLDSILFCWSWKIICHLQSLRRFAGDLLAMRLLKIQMDVNDDDSRFRQFFPKSLIFYSLVTYQCSIIIIINHCLFLNYQVVHYNKTFEVLFIALWWFSYFMPSPLPRLLFTLFTTSKNLYLGCFLDLLPSPIPWLLFRLFLPFTTLAAF